MLSTRCSCLVLVLAMTLSPALGRSFMAEDGFETFPTAPGSRYKLYTIHQTWTEALSLCQGDGGGSHLVIINSQAEAEVVKEMFARITDTKVHFLLVGINDINTEGTWITVLGDPVSTTGYNVWANGEPNNHGGNEDCGTIDRNGGYNDGTCTKGVNPFICEKPDV